MGNSFLDSYNNKPVKKKGQNKDKSILISLRIPPDLYIELQKLRSKDGSLSKTIIKALRYALEKPE